MGDKDDFMVRRSSLTENRASFTTPSPNSSSSHSAASSFLSTNSKHSSHRSSFYDAVPSILEDLEGLNPSTIYTANGMNQFRNSLTSPNPAECPQVNEIDCDQVLLGSFDGAEEFVGSQCTPRKHIRPNGFPSPSAVTPSPSTMRSINLTPPQVNLPKVPSFDLPARWLNSSLHNLASFELTIGTPRWNQRLDAAQYRITVRANIPTLQGNMELVVTNSWRRYSEFRELKRRLARVEGTNTLAKFPGKAVFKNRRDKALLAKRAKKLQAWTWTVLATHERRINRGKTYRSPGFGIDENVMVANVCLKRFYCSGDSNCVEFSKIDQFSLDSNKENEASNLLHRQML